jgi:hypothetical protein
LSYFSDFSSDRIRPPLVFLPPGVSFTVKSLTALGGGATIIRCEELPHAVEGGEALASLANLVRTPSMILDLTYLDDDGEPTAVVHAAGPLSPRGSTEPGADLAAGGGGVAGGGGDAAGAGAGAGDVGGGGVAPTSPSRGPPRRFGSGDTQEDNSFEEVEEEDEPDYDDSYEEEMSYSGGSGSEDEDY